MFIKLHYKTMTEVYAMLANVDNITHIIEQADGNAWICFENPDHDIEVEESLEEVEGLLITASDGRAAFKPRREEDGFTY